MQTHFSFRYLPRNTKVVYYPSKQLRSYYSKPFPVNDNLQNVLTFYHNTALIPEELAHNIQTIPVKDMEYLTSVFKMPAIVILTAYCDVKTSDEINEVYFVRQQLYKEQIP